MERRLSPTPRMHYNVIVEKNYAHCTLLGLTPLLTRRVGHRNDGGQFHLFQVFLGAMYVASGTPGTLQLFSTTFHRGDHMKIQEVSINHKVKKKLEGLRGATNLDQLRTPSSASKR